MPIYPGRRKGTLRVKVWSLGRWHEEVVEGSKAEAREHEARLRIELGAGSRLTQRIAPLFFDFSTADYSPHARKTLGANTWRKVRRYQVAQLVSFFGSYRLSEITTALVDSYSAARKAEVQPTTVNNELRVLGTMLRWAREDLGLPVRADLRFRRLRPNARRVRTWSEADVQRLFTTTERDDPALLPMVLFLLNTGCRKGEAIAARWDWWNPRRRLLSIGPTDDWSPKSRRPREVPLPDRMARVLARLARTSPWIFPSAIGEHFLEFPNKRFAALVAAAGLKGGPHTARHTYASMFLAAKPDLPLLASILGHSTTRTTELYAHLLPDWQERARNVVDLMPQPRRTGARTGARARRA